MAWEVFKTGRDRLARDERRVSLDPGHFVFNPALSASAELKVFNEVEIHVDAPNFKIGFRFSRERTEASRPIHDQQGKKTFRCNLPADLKEKYPWIRRVAHERNNKLRRFAATLEGKIWSIQLAPIFELVGNRDGVGVPFDASGIYRYRSSEEEIVYIGRGNIRRRLNEAQRDDWDFSRVEYSIVSPENQAKWENFYLERYKDEFGKAPSYNRNLGEKPKVDQKEQTEAKGTLLEGE